MKYAFSKRVIDDWNLLPASGPYKPRTSRTGQCMNMHRPNMTAPCLVHNMAMYTIQYTAGAASMAGARIIHWPVRGLYGPPASCINCSTVNTFKKHLSSELESEAVKFTVCQL